MKDISENDLTTAINDLTEKLSKVLLQEFLKLSQELQLNIVLIKSAQLLLANILCQVTNTKEELKKVSDLQGLEMKELTLDCAITGFSHKFNINKH